MRVASASAAGVFRAARLNQMAELGTRELPRRRHAEENAGEYRQSSAERQDWKIHFNGGFVREGIEREQRGESIDTFVCGDYAQGGSGDGEKHGFGEELADQAAASRADGDTHGKFVLAGGAAGKQQDRDIGARDH